PSSLFLFRPLLSPRSTLFPYTTLFRSWTPVPALSHALRRAAAVHGLPTLSRGRRRRQPHRRVRPERARRHHRGRLRAVRPRPLADRKSTRLNSSHQIISYAVFCLKKKQ